MVECTNPGNSRGVCQRLEQTGKSNHYGPWHSHDSAPQMGPYFGLAEAKNHPEERLLDQAQARVSYTPLFGGHSRSIPQGMIFDVQPLVKS